MKVSRKLIAVSMMLLVISPYALSDTDFYFTNVNHRENFILNAGNTGMVYTYRPNSLQYDNRHSLSRWHGGRPYNGSNHSRYPLSTGYSENGFRQGYYVNNNFRNDQGHRHCLWDFSPCYNSGYQCYTGKPNV